MELKVDNRYAISLSKNPFSTREASILTSGITLLMSAWKFKKLISLMSLARTENQLADEVTRESEISGNEACNWHEGGDLKATRPRE
jgi:hypothetical protein